MKCAVCKAEILQPNPEMCPYCGSRNSAVSDEQLSVLHEREEQAMLEEIEKLVRAGRYEDAARGYESLEMWDEAGECRRKAKTNYVVTASLSIGKVGTISIDCPHCSASQNIASKSNEVTCQYCGKKYVIPKKVLDLL